MFVVPALLAAVGLLVLLAPAVASVLCGFVIAVQMLGLALRFWSTGQAVPVPAARAGVKASPIFTVHVATHNEPPELVIATLRALAAQDWPATDFEVIVIDNNTADPALWLPVSDACEAMGPHIRFMHRDGVRGAKAGALNIALTEARSDATHVVTVDADYVVGPQFLRQAATALGLTGADYVQFPQAYVGSAGVADGVDAELAEYFLTSARRADIAEAVLLTGTLCVISIAALRAVGGWSGRTITEDADLGVRLCRDGFTGRFIGQVVGRGVLPFSLSDLSRQRHRWASGNLQTLRAHAPALLSWNTGMSLHRRAAVISQLTAWLNLSLLPVAALLFGLATGQGGRTLLVLAGLSVWLTLADIAVRLLGQGCRAQTPLPVRAAAICHRLALAPVAACATLEALCGRSLGFTVTNKSGATRTRDLPTAGLLLFGAALLSLPAALPHGWVVTGAVLALLLPLPAGLITARALETYRRHVTTPLTGATP